MTAEAREFWTGFGLWLVVALVIGLIEACATVPSPEYCASLVEWTLECQAAAEAAYLRGE